MYFITNAKKLDFMWKMLRREHGGLQSYEQPAQKISETIVRSVPLLSVTPESQGLSSEEIINFYKELSDFNKYKPHSAVIMKNGRVVSKTAWKPYSTGVRHVTHSLAKSIISLAIGGELTRRYNFQSLSKKLKQELTPVDLLKKMRKKGNAAEKQSEDANG